VSNGVEQPTTILTPMHGLIVVGVALFATWLARTSLGHRALAGSKPRRHRVAPVTLFIPFLVWFFGPVLLQLAAQPIIGSVKGWRFAFAANVVMCLGSLAAVAVTLLLVRHEFVRGVPGWGLRLRTIPRDFGVALVDLLAVWPLVLVMIVLVMTIGKMLQGPTYEIPRHEELQLLTTSTRLSLQILIIILAVVVAPLVEEMLFRGLLQTLIRSHLQRPWPSVALTAGMFAVVHVQNPEHWPALFVLAMGLGYAYEKSGSLWQPIFMHALFNGLTIASVLTEAPGM
jgi:membrane protease YdiL (CAAX protease family)